jgi:hypothetical protein
MAVYRLFKNEPFGPEAISTMTHTYTEVCRTLGLTDGALAGADDEAKKTVARTAVAKTVIEYAQRGARDPVRLRDCVLQALRNYPVSAKRLS